MYSSMHFIVSGLIFKSLIHFMLICVIGVNLTSFACGFPILPTPCIKQAFFSLLYVFGSFVENSCSYMCGFISGVSILFHWSVCLFLSQYHTILNIVALQYNLKSKSMIPPAWFIFSQDHFGYLRSVLLQFKFDNFLN